MVSSFASASTSKLQKTTIRSPDDNCVSPEEAEGLHRSWVEGADRIVISSRLLNDQSVRAEERERSSEKSGSVHARGGKLAAELEVAELKEGGEVAGDAD